MKDTLSAAVVLIGNELLSGSIQDKNLAHIAKELEVRGIRIRETRIIPDIESEIVEAVNHLRQKFDYVFTTGGIGPTHDDITSDSMAAAFGVNNVIQQTVFEQIDKRFKEKGIPFTKEAQRMAYAPQGSEIIASKHSIIPGYRIDNVFVMAGVPSIMRLMLEGVIEHLNTGLTIHNKAIHANVGEGEIAHPLGIIQDQHPNIDIGSYPQDKNSEFSDYRVIFMVKGTDLEEIQITCDKILAACKDRGHDAILA
ncbi:competence/damage-inducible protein A [Arenicella sp. 4NH20-0111]|uniref:competence/damage-inducible protein A n=1 Tax=Arenicella sp. 4NH20-0111 TaxID=3127648 RepID=UPI003103102F